VLGCMKSDIEVSDSSTPNNISSSSIRQKKEEDQLF
jgi:hypothetical protein